MKPVKSRTSPDDWFTLYDGVCDNDNGDTMAKRDAYSIDEEWFGLLSDEEKAKILVTKIKETEETKRRLHDNDGYQLYRIVAIVLLAAVISVGMCVGNNSIEAWRHVQTCNAAPSKCTPFVPASSSAVVP